MEEITNKKIQIQGKLNFVAKSCIFLYEPTGYSNHRSNIWLFGTALAQQMLMFFILFYFVFIKQRQTVTLLFHFYVAVGQFFVTQRNNPCFL